MQELTSSRNGIGGVGLRWGDYCGKEEREKELGRGWSRCNQRIKSRLHSNLLQTSGGEDVGNLSGGGGGVVPFKEDDWSKGKRGKRKIE